MPFRLTLPRFIEKVGRNAIPPTLPRFIEKVGRNAIPPYITTDKHGLCTQVSIETVSVKSVFVRVQRFNLTG